MDGAGFLKIEVEGRLEALEGLAVDLALACGACVGDG